MSLLLNKNEIENHTTMVLDELLRDIEKDINDISKDKTETRSATLKIKMQLDDASGAVLVAIQGTKTLAPTLKGFYSEVEDTDQLNLYGAADED